MVLQLDRPMFDVAIVGGGPAGLSAALMLGRCRRRVLVLDLGHPRNQRSRALHGYLTRDGIAPSSLHRTRTRRARDLRRRAALNRRDRRAAGRRSLSTSRSANGREEDARYLLIATGVVDDLPAIAGFDACYGLSIFHCPYCDGWERRDRPLAAFGRGDGGRRPRARLENVERRRPRLHPRPPPRAPPARARLERNEHRASARNRSPDSSTQMARSHASRSVGRSARRAKRCSSRPDSIRNPAWRSRSAAR